MNTTSRDPDHPYPVLCSWCLKNKNLYTVCGFCAVPDSHGICQQCRNEMREDSAKKGGTR